MKKVLAVFLILLLAAGGMFFYLMNRPSSKISTKYNGFHFISEDEDIDNSDFDRIDGQYYLSLDYIVSHIDDKVHYDEKEKTVIFTNKTGTSYFTVDQSEGFKNGKVELRDPVIIKEGKVMVPIEAFIYDYPVDLRFIKERNVLLLDRTNVEYATGKARGEKIPLREEPSKSSPRITYLDGEVYVYGETGKWYKVRQKNGFAGYILKDDLDVNFPENPFESPKDEKKEALLKEPLNLTWDYTYGKETPARLAAIRKIPGVNKICPTWFSIKSGQGDLIDRGSKEYVEKYRSFGIDTWAYLDNSFDPEITHEALSSPSTRRKIINGVMDLLHKYDLKGINIDFEHTKIEDRDNITQFMRELAATLHLEDIIVSIDVTPQISTDISKEPYHRKELAEVCDFIMLMAYDQHWASSPEAGSVAEYKWVEGNLNNLFRQIPMEKLVLCVPLYTRIWNVNGGKVSSKTASMSDAAAFVARNGLSPVWLDEAKQFYAETPTEKIWLEEIQSLGYKVSLVNKYNLAGVASWRLGFETPDVWPEIAEILKKKNVDKQGV